MILSPYHSSAVLPFLVFGGILQDIIVIRNAVTADDRPNTEYGTDRRYGRLICTAGAVELLILYPVHVPYLYLYPHGTHTVLVQSLESTCIAVLVRTGTVCTGPVLVQFIIVLQ